MNHNLEVLRMSSPAPTLGRIPFLMIDLGKRLHKRGLVGNPRWHAKFIPSKPKPESES